jgi:hypothetical protein
VTVLQVHRGPARPGRPPQRLLIYNRVVTALTSV